ncbi:type III-B CRISPR module-associated Cmr3 family protein [Streptomyces sp. NPDC047860]|uniref:type III-B CRISPR module-associated Cmr3 family protein n=1 Tax=Streptomyces sp. NPDC047860 TaxID=3155743 RepID=UPI0033DBDC25
MLDVRLTAHQPLALGVRPTGTAPMETQLHVPGSVLRGALAAAWIRDHGLPAKVSPELREEFIALFESDTLYGPLFADGSAIVPLSVLRCKYQGCEGVHVDAAFPGDETPTACPACGGPLAAGRGEVEFFGASGRRLVVQSTHLQIDDGTQVAAEGQLFTRRALSHRDAADAPRRFHGSITPGPNLPPGAAAWLQQQRRLRLGGRRGTHGGVTYSARTVTPQPPATGTSVALRLLGPAVLADASGLLLDPADREALRHALDEELSEVLGTRIAAVQRVWTRRERVGGWHAASNLPKPVELAVGPGTVVLLTFDRPPAPERLLALTRRGIGLRRNEGLGALTADTRAWSPPSGPVATAAPEVSADPAVAYADLLERTGHSAWFCDQLRPFLEELDATGARAGTDILSRPRLRNLTQDQKDDIERMLISAPVDVLDRTLRRLDALRRLGEASQRS